MTDAGGRVRHWHVTDWNRLHLERGESPGLSHGTLRLRTLAASLNHRDLRMIEGRYDRRIPLPLVPLSDAVGEVVEVGPGVRRVEVGDRVCPTFSPTWIAGPPDWDAVRLTRGGAVPGVLAEELVVGEHEVVRVPEHLDAAEAATLPCAALTAWSALEGVVPGDTVLVLGTGGVSIFALQFARLRGARVLATTSSERKAQVLRALGADLVIRYDQEPRWGREARRAAGAGVDRVIEVGGVGTLEQSLDAVRPGGTVASIGVVAGDAGAPPLFPVFMKAVRLQGVFVGSREQFEAMNRAVALHRLRPVVDEVFAFEEAPGAFERLASGGHVGKVCVAVDPSVATGPRPLPGAAPASS